MPAPGKDPDQRPDSERSPLNPAPRRPKTVEEQLDEALADSFPASDPVSFTTSQTEEYWRNGRKNGS